MSTHDVAELPPDLTKLLIRLGSRKLVLVEGQTDRSVFRIWFQQRLADIEFFAPEVPQGESGVRTLLPNVAAQISPGRVYGILDRDFHSDAEVNASPAAPTAQLFMLRRYCIENYLLEPEAILEELSLFPATASNLPDALDMFQSLLQMCQQLHTMMAANWVFSEAGGVRYFPPAHDLLERDKLVAEAARRLACDIVEAEQRIAEKEALIAPLLTTLDAAYTRINGKHLLFQVHKRYIKKEPSWNYFANLLARTIRDRIGIHADIRTIIEDRILK